MRRALASLVALAALATPSLARAEWRWSFSDVNPSQSSNDAVDPNGSSGGRVNGLGRASATTFYAASEWGGLFRTTDGGATWAHLDGHVPQTTWDVEVDPSNANRIYATSLYDGRTSSLAGINVSTDGGLTWTHPPTATPPAGFCADAARRTEPSAFGISIDPNNNARVWIGTNCGIARSIDSGVTWTFLDPTPADGADDVWDVVVHDSGIVDLCGDDGHMRTTNGGTGWTGAGLTGGTCSIAVSPDEANVLFWVNGTTLRESEDGGVNWSAPFTNPRPQGRIPFVAVNQRAGTGFDLYFGDTQLWRATCTTPSPANNNRRCPTNTWTTIQNGSHWDAGDVAFAPGASDACPVLFSNDGGIYRNTLTTSPGCHTPAWEQPTTSVHALWVMGMTGENQTGTAAEDVYFGDQDTGTFASTTAPASPPTWTNRDCCDSQAIAGEPTRVVYTVCCTSPGRANRVYVRNQGMTGGAELNSYPPGNVAGFTQTNALVQYAANSYALVTTSGLFVTANIGANPVVWTQLGTATSPANIVGVQVGVTGGTPTFYAIINPGNGSQPSRLWRYVGTTSTGTWTEVARPGNTGGFGVYAVDPVNPQRLMVSHLRAGQPPEMMRTIDGGGTWTPMTGLDTLMTAGGTFQYANTRGWRPQFPGSAASAFSGYAQPSMLAFDPENTSIQAAGAIDAGVFITFDDGATWQLVSDPLTPATTRRPHIPAPQYAYFDHEGSTVLTQRFALYVGTRGRGVWRVNFSQQLIIFNICQRHPDLCRIPKMEPGLVVLPCGRLDHCIVRDLIPKNCLVKYQCPGCATGLCPPWYRLVFDGIDPRSWDVTLVDSKGDAPVYERVEREKGVALTFQPPKEQYKEGSIGDFEVVFALRDGRRGEDLRVTSRLEVCTESADVCGGPGDKGWKPAPGPAAAARELPPGLELRRPPGLDVPRRIPAPQ